MIEIRTERLLLRGFVPEDASRITQLDADPGVMEFLDKGPSTDESNAAWIALLAERYPSGSERGFWAAEEDGVFVGWFSLRPARDTGEMELGYRLRTAAWGRGPATEGSRALLGLVAGERVIARTMIVNRRSRRVMEKLGMRVVRTFPYSGEGPDDEIEYATE